VRIRVDLDLCQGHGTCAEEAPEIFAVDEKELKVIIREERAPDALHAKVKRAVRFCPTRALSIVED
jgi:ferredoxin